MESKKIDLEQIRFILIAIVAVSLPFSESLKTISLVMVLICFLFEIYRRGIRYKLSIIHYGFLFLLLSSIISSFFANNIGRSLSGSKDILFFTIPFFVAYSITNERHIRTILRCLFVSSTLAALLGIFQSIETSKPLEIHALGNQNYTAMFFTIVLTSIVSTILFSNKETPFQRSILIVSLIIILLASAMTLMRASFLGLFAFFVLLLILRKPSRSLFIIILSFICLTFIVLYLDRAMWQKLFSLKSMISRLDIWEEAIRLFIANPIFGVGLNHFSFKFPSDHPVEPNNIVYDAHSLYFQTASQLGLIGLLSLAVIFIGFIMAWRSIEDSTSFGKVLRYASLGAFLIIAITGLFDTTFHHEHAIAFSLISGLAFGYSKGKRVGL